MVLMPTPDTLELFDALYEDLRQRATAQMRRQPVGHTLHPPALGHEGGARLRNAGTEYPNRASFLMAASRAMRSVLVDSARAKSADKRIPRDAMLRRISDPDGLFEGDDPHVGSLSSAFLGALGRSGWFLVRCGGRSARQAALSLSRSGFRALDQASLTHFQPGIVSEARSRSNQLSLRTRTPAAEAPSPEQSVARCSPIPSNPECGRSRRLA